MDSYLEKWSLDPEIDYLNHGAFGACPIVVQLRQQELRDRMEREPFQFLTRVMQPLIDESREALGNLIGAAPENLALVGNATAGVNAVLRSRDVELGPKDEILVTNLGYNACNNAARYVAERTGSVVRLAEIPFPLSSSEEVVTAIEAAVTDQTRIAIVDHVTSGTGLKFPLEQIVPMLKQRGIEVIVDGAHAPGMVPLAIEALGADYYTGNCHKWLCAPKGAGFLYVAPEHQDKIAPLVISHGWNTPRQGRSRFSDVMDWPGTLDPTPWICVKEAIEFVDSLLPGGINALMQRNRELVLRGRNLLVEQLGVPVPAPDDMIGSLATIKLPDDPSREARLDRTTTPSPTLLIQEQLFRRYRIDVPFFSLPSHPERGFRISAQAYNDLSQYDRLGEALKELLAEGL
tara:strand:- start:2741 stop:3952 length:1212 start_codon:yes stop_codon:yes gene_type:complete